MKKLALIILAAAASLMAQNGYSGIYNGKGILPSARYSGGVPYTLQVTLIQTGNSLTGSLKVGNNKPVPIVSGTVSGTSLTFATGGRTQSTAQLSANGAQLTGRVTSSAGVVYEVALKKN